jgi:hypothetical protein
MNKSESIASLSKALVLAQSEFPRVAFNSTNPYFNSNYADLGAVIETSKPILKSHGLAVSQLVEGAAGEVGITTLLIHESGEYISSCVTILVDGKNLAQEAGKSITYLRRYALAAILGLYADQDNDGNDSAHKIETKAPEKKQEVKTDSKTIEVPDKVTNQEYYTLTRVKMHMSLEDSNDFLAAHDGSFEKAFLAAKAQLEAK